MRYREILEKVIERSYKGAPSLFNPSKKELESAILKSPEHSMRGLVTESGDIYLADAYFNSHTDFTERQGINEDEVARISINYPWHLILEITEEKLGDN